MKKTLARKATIPTEISDKILCLRPYQNDVIPEELVIVSKHGYEAAQQKAFEILLTVKDVVRVILCGMDVEGDVTESGVVWVLADAKPWYVETKETHQSEPKIEHFEKKEDAYKQYRSYREQGVITDTNARAKKNGEAI